MWGTAHISHTHTRTHWLINVECFSVPLKAQFHSKTRADDNALLMYWIHFFPLHCLFLSFTFICFDSYSFTHSDKHYCVLGWVISFSTQGSGEVLKRSQTRPHFCKSAAVSQQKILWSPAYGGSEEWNNFLMLSNVTVAHSRRNGL